MKIKYLLRLLFLVLLTATLFMCKKDPDDDGHDIPLVYTSLTVARDTIFAGDTTALTAVASGYQLTYEWYVAKGDLLGSGNQVTFLATPCTVGTNTVVCTVRDGNGKETEKEVTITVF
jgi:hypothetical protein